MKTKIDYLTHVINIINGCSYGCSYCFARNRVAPRLAHNCRKCGKFIPHFHEERLKLINRIKKPSIVGLNFMGDTWDKNVEPEWRKQIWERVIMNHISETSSNFIVLTKQPQNINQSDFNVKNETISGMIKQVFHYPNNLWVGVSVEHIERIDRWVALSQKEYIKHKIISIEPVLGDSNSIGRIYHHYELYFKKYGYPEWIILGALTKSFKGEMENSRNNAKSLLSYFKRMDVKVPIFVKDNCGIKNAPREFPKEMKNV